MAEGDNIYIGDMDGLIIPMDITLSPGDGINVEESPAFGWKGNSLKLSIGGVLPLVYGRHRISPILINAYVEEGENETLNMLLAWCEGEIESISNIQLNGNPIENLYGANLADPYGESAELTTRTGKINQQPIDGFSEVHGITPINVILKTDAPYIFRGTSSEAQAYRIEFEIDRLFQTGEDEVQHSWYFSIRVEIRKSGTLDFETLGIIDMNKMTLSPFKRYFMTEYMAAGKHDLRITKVSEDQDEGLGAIKFGEVTINSIDEITSENLEYPGVAVSGIRILALTDSNGAVPNVTGLVTGKKVRVPKVTYTLGGDDLVDWEDYYWDGAALSFKKLGGNSMLYWDGASYVEAFSANPVWCLRDLLTSKRYGLGDFIEESGLIQESFLACAKYCDEVVVNDEGYNEKRFRLDCAFDIGSSATDAIASILKSFRGMLFQSEGCLRLTVEKAEQPVALFNMGNIIAGTFKLQYLSKSIPNVMVADFTNQDKEYSRDRVEVADSEQSVADVAPIQQSVTLFGVTRLTQVLRESRIQLNKIKNNRRILSFSAYFDAILLQPFDVFEFQHDVPGWGAGGRVREYCTPSCIHLDKDVLIAPGVSYQLKVRNSETDLIESVTVTNIPGVYKSLNISPALSFTPQDYDIWSLGEVSGDIQAYRIVSLNRQESGLVTIQAVEHNNDVYDESAVIIPKDIYTHLILDIPKVFNLYAEEVHNKLPSGGIETKLNVSFKVPPVTAKYVKKAVAYEIWMSDNGGASWGIVGTVDKGFYSIPEFVSKGVTYTIAVVSITETAEKNPISQSPQYSLTIQGYTTPPKDVVNFNYTFTDEIVLSWDKSEDNDVIGYEIRTRDDSWYTDNGELVWRGMATKFVVVRPTARKGVKYYIRAISSYGLVSAQSTECEPQNPAPLAPTVYCTQLFQKAFLSWTPIFDEDIVGYEIWSKPTPDFFGVDDGDEKVVTIAVGLSIMTAVPNDPTYFRIAAVDRFGRGDYSNVVSANQMKVGTFDISPDSIKSTHISDNSISSPQITAGAVLSEHIATKAILAEQINVAELSSITAHLGRIESGEIIGALIKTADDGQRIELDSLGLRAYDGLQRKTVDITQGAMTLYNPADPRYFSYLDGGALVFQTPYGTTPYATRIKSGVAVSGQRVTLPQWISKPDVLVGIKRIAAYNKAYKESSQEWCVYADNFSAYNYGGSNFGWQFDVKAKLVISGGSRENVTFQLPFDVVKCTGVNTCEIQTVHELNIFQNKKGPDPLCYGCLCYQILYRKVGAAQWCACNYQYEQPHSTKDELKTTQTLCHTMKLGGVGTWEVMMHETGRHYVVSAHESSGWQPFLCKYYEPCDCSRYSTETSSAYQSVRLCQVLSYTFPSRYLPADYWKHPEDFVLTCSVHRQQPYTMNFSTPSGSIVCACACYEASGSLVAYTNWSRGIAEITFADGWGKSESARVNGYPNYCYESVAMSNSRNLGAGASSIPFSLDASIVIHQSTTNDYVCSDISVSGFIRYCVKYECTVQILKCCWVNIYFGDACDMNRRMWMSMRDITGNEDVLDPFGEVSYLAIAYK